MAGIKTYILSGATLTCALGIGYVMQYGVGLPGSSEFKSPPSVQVSAITNTSSAGFAPKPVAPVRTDNADVNLVAAPEAFDPSPDAGIVSEPVAPQADASANNCTVELDANTTAGAMVDLKLSAPCHKGDRVTIHHNGMMFTENMSSTGKLKLRVPALTERAVFMASFLSGGGATAITEVSSLPFYERVVVQWKGDAGLQLHAREFTTDYFVPGHVWAEAKGDLGVAARGEGGFMTRLGQSDAPDAHLVEVYSFPTATAKRDGNVLMSVEAEITQANCGQTVAAQTIQIHPDEGMLVRELEMEMPSCETVGDFLVLKNLVEDLTIAAK